MKIFNLSLSLSLSLSLCRKVFLIAFLISIMNGLKAQDIIKDLEKQFNVTIDSSYIKATPYRQIEIDGVIQDEDKKIDYYNDITIYEIKSNEDKPKGEANRATENIKPAIFMLPGGGFAGYASSDIEGMDLLGSLSLGSKLANQLPASVNIIKYALANTQVQKIKNVVLPLEIYNCSDFLNQTGRALLLDASYKAFHDLRKILKVNFLDSAAIKQLDPNNFFMIGSSAGAILALNTLFLQSNEIPSSITYQNNCSNNNTNSIVVSSAVRNEYWPIPTLKGIVTFAGAWIYDNVTHLTANTPASSLNTPLYMLHGTCDELISRREGIIGFKKWEDTDPNPLIFNYVAHSNDFSPSWFINGKGSEYIFNAFKSTHCKMIYGQVMRGTHGIFSGSNGVSAWDIITNTYPKDTVTAQVKPFIKDLIDGVSTFTTHTRVLYPDKPSNDCLSTDDSLGIINFNTNVSPPTIVYNNNICNNAYNYNYTATLGNLPVAPYSISWSSTGNISLVGATNGVSVQYKTTSPINNSGTLKATLTKGCNVKAFEYLVNVNANKVDTIDMVSYCYSGVMGTAQREYPAASQILYFKAVYEDAIAEGITTMQWELLCGGITYSTAVLNQMIGNNLQSSLILGPAPSGCTQVRVRYLRPCGQYSAWFTGNLKHCPSWVPPSLMVYPNPSNEYFSISLAQDKTVDSEEGIEVMVVDAMGNEVLKTSLHSTDEKISIIDLKPDIYKIVVFYQSQVYFSTLIKN